MARANVRLQDAISVLHLCPWIVHPSLFIILMCGHPVNMRHSVSCKGLPARARSSECEALGGVSIQVGGRLQSINLDSLLLYTLDPPALDFNCTEAKYSISAGERGHCSTSATFQVAGSLTRVPFGGDAQESFNLTTSH